MKKEEIECFEVKQEHIELFKKFTENPAKFLKFRALDIIDALNKNPFKKDEIFYDDISNFSESLINEVLLIFLDMEVFWEVLKDNIHNGVKKGVYIKNSHRDNLWHLYRLL